MARAPESDRRHRALRRAEAGVDLENAGKVVLGLNSSGAQRDCARARMRPRGGIDRPALPSLRRRAEAGRAQRRFPSRAL